jgi:hypothetical protein
VAPTRALDTRPSVLPDEPLANLDTILRVQIRAELRGDVDVLFRPEQLRVSAGRAATIDSVQYLGHDAVYLTRLPGGAAPRLRVLDAPSSAPATRSTSPTWAARPSATRVPQNAGQVCPTRMRRAWERCSTSEGDVDTCPAF